MRTLKTIWFTTLLLAVGQLSAQWMPGGNVTGGTDYLGAAAGSTIPLHLRTIPDLSIDFSTSNLLRMRLNPTQNNTINGFAVPTDGFLGLGTTTVGGTAPGTPWTRLHLHDVISGAGFVSAGFRDWMRNGVTFTGHGDQMYVGHKYGLGAQDPTDAVFQWADNSTDQLGPDLMRFIFTGSYTGAATGENSLFGKEIMQLHPSGFVGVGDWNAVVAIPNERLDVLDGKVRVRALPSDPPSTSMEAVVVNTTTGVLEHRPFPTTTGGADCDWDVDPANFKVTTAWKNPGSNGSCPDARWKLGIGTAAPGYKLDIFHDENNSVAAGGLRVDYRGLDAGTSYGIKVDLSQAQTALSNGVGTQSVITGFGTSGYGMLGKALSNVAGASVTKAIGTEGSAFINAGSCTESIGVYGYSENGPGGTATFSYGVKATSSGSASGGVQYSYGIRAKASGGTIANYSVFGDVTGSGASDWSAYFPGRCFIGGTVFVPSDEALKSNLVPISSAGERLMQLQPMGFTYNTEEFPSLGLSEGQQYGFIAQQLAEVFPDMVTDMTHPPTFDSLGVEVSPAVEFKAVSLDDLTPVLVAGFQEDHAALAAVVSAQTEQQDDLNELRSQVAEQQVQIDELMTMLHACCNAQAPTDRGDSRSIGTGIEDEQKEDNDRKLRIVPNPFETHTTVYYDVDRSGRVQLLANSADGKQLRVLKEADTESGNYRFEWSTGDLAPGIYYVTLLLDGQPVTKRAVKIAR